MFNIVVLLLLSLFASNHGSITDLEELMEHQEQLVLELATETERLYQQRCSTTLESCRERSYNECLSLLPSMSCPAENLGIEECGECASALFDYSSSVIRLPDSVGQWDGSNLEPNSAEVKESICYGADLDTFFTMKNEEFFRTRQYGDRLPQMYFGASNGAMRIYPGRGSKECGKYDPRKRPWYIAASSGPKDVIIVIDISGSMNNLGRLFLAKEAAKEVIFSLTIGDHFSVVTFSTGASSLLPGNVMLRGTADNKEYAMTLIDDIYAGGSTNFYSAFEKAFNVLDDSISQEHTSNCHKSVLFLTDGVMDTDYTKDQVSDLITSRNEGYGAHIFTYSLGSSADVFIPKSIACDTGGLFTQIPDGADLAAAMSSYYKLYAMGLGNNTVY